MKIEWRKLFPLSWYRLSKGYDFNGVIFYIDTLLLSIGLSILIAVVWGYIIPK